jgi:hypothetical protein
MKILLIRTREQIRSGSPARFFVHLGRTEWRTSTWMNDGARLVAAAQAAMKTLRHLLRKVYVVAAAQAAMKLCSWFVGRPVRVAAAQAAIWPAR